MGWPDRTERSFGRTLRHALFAALLPIALPIPTLAQAGQAQIFPTAPLPTAEFDAPYAIDVLSGGEIIQISGSFSWAMPQNFIAALAGAPHVRTIRFDSPGGHVQAALQIADVIHDRGLDTYVPRFCASACTLAFLAGKHRFLAPTAQLGFHQAHAPGVAPEIFDPVLRAVYGSTVAATSLH
jgi:membrane-bound ClpP family serine protease